MDKEIPNNITPHNIFDKAYKRISSLSPKSVVNLINAFFNTNFPEDSEVTYLDKETIKEDMGEIEADKFIIINNVKKYHTEVQIENDRTIALRMFEYDYYDSIKYKKILENGSKVVLNFPESRIIYLEHTRTTPDVVTLEFRRQDGSESYFYKVTTIKFLDWSLKELIEKKLFTMLPLYLLKYRKKVKYASKKGDLRSKAREIINLIKFIMTSVEGAQKADEITIEDKNILLMLIKELSDYIYGKYDELIEEGVISVAEGAYKFSFDDVLDELNTTRKESKKKDNIINLMKEKHKRELAEKEKEKAVENFNKAKEALAEGMAVEKVIKIFKLSEEEAEKLR
jgi:hypothetical protein